MSGGGVSRYQAGVVLLETLIAILVFALGVLAMIALQATAIAIQSDAQYRVEAANYVDDMMGKIVLNVNRSSVAALQASLASFAHNTTGAAASCSFSGAASGNADVTAWVTSITSGANRLPGATSAMQQITVDTATFNQVAITLCWQTPKDPVARRHTLVTYIN